MDDFTRIRTFIKVVEAGSFSAAARDGQSVSAIARQVKALPVSDLCLDEHGELRRLVNVFVDGGDVRHGAGLETPLRAETQVLVVTAIAGG